MTQEEVIQALKNLGGKAMKKDLEKEYFRLHFPPEIYGKDYFTIQTKRYDIWTNLSKYVNQLRIDGIIHSKRVYVGYNNTDNPIKKGSKSSSVEFSISLK